MHLLPSFLLILTCLSGSFSKQDLQNKVFVFPEASNSAAVVLNAAIQQPLKKVTVSLKHYTMLTRGHAIFSYATKNSDNEILISKPRSNQYSVYIGGANVTYTLPEKQKTGWEHTVMTWDSDTGLLGLWLDGQALPRTGIQRGFSIREGGSIILGQYQDTDIGGFDINQSFLGEISDVNLWPGVLPADQIRLVSNGGALSGQLVNWRSLSYSTRGNVVVADSLR